MSLCVNRIQYLMFTIAPTDSSCHRIVFIIIRLCFSHVYSSACVCVFVHGCVPVGFAIKIFTIQCAFGKYLLTCVRHWWVRWWAEQRFFFRSVSVKTALKPNSQSAFHRYTDTVCFCSIVCLLREQIKLNRCERRWAFEQPSPSSTLYLCSALCLSSSPPLSPSTSQAFTIR